MLNLNNTNDYDLSIVGEKIKYERELLLYTQENLAEQLDIIASKSKKYNNKQKSRQTIANWEKGETYPSYQDMVNLCKLFKCDIDYLTGKIPCKTRENTDIQKETRLTEETIKRIKMIPSFRLLIEYISKGLIPYDSDNNIGKLFDSIEKYIQTPDTELKQSAIAMYEIQDNLSKLRMNIQHQEKDIHKRLF